MAADSGMETCPSPEIADSRKRPLDCDVENGATKRSHYGTGESPAILTPADSRPCVCVCAVLPSVAGFEVRDGLAAGLSLQPSLLPPAPAPRCLHCRSSSVHLCAVFSPRPPLLNGPRAPPELALFLSL